MTEILNASPQFPQWVSEDAKGFVFWALTKDGRRRPTIAQLAGHSWITRVTSGQQQGAQPGGGYASSHADSYGRWGLQGATASHLWHAACVAASRRACLAVQRAACCKLRCCCTT
jgi:hypothetical protein